jgi:molecular chaperone DnaK (HSP70)
LINSGTITTNGDQANAVDRVSVANAVVINTGTIVTYGERSLAFTTAINYDNDFANISNSGLIATHGNNSTAVNLISDDAVMINTGSIESYGQNYTALIADGNNSSVTNSGVIMAKAENARAISIVGTGSTFNLLSGSKIFGRVDLGGNTLNIAQNKGAAQTLKLDNVGTVNLSGTAFATQANNAVLFIDPSGLVLSGASTSAIFSQFHQGIHAQNITTADNPKGRWVRGYRTETKSDAEKDLLARRQYSSGVMG